MNSCKDLNRVIYRCRARLLVLRANQPTFDNQPEMDSQKQKTRHGAGSIDHANNTRNYPAAVGTFGRRARDVMPAAIRALVRTTT